VSIKEHVLKAEVTKAPKLVMVCKPLGEGRYWKNEENMKFEVFLEASMNMSVFWVVGL
jgi:hypothetical protein